MITEYEKKGKLPPLPIKDSMGKETTKEKELKQGVLAMERAIVKMSQNPNYNVSEDLFGKNYDFASSKENCKQNEMFLSLYIILLLIDKRDKYYNINKVTKRFFDLLLLLELEEAKKENPKFNTFKLLTLYISELEKIAYNEESENSFYNLVLEYYNQSSEIIANTEADKLKVSQFKSINQSDLDAISCLIDSKREEKLLQLYSKLIFLKI